MAESVRERIVQDVVTTLQGVTVANGYAHTLASVQRFHQAGQLTADTPVCVVMEGDDTVEQDGPLAGGYGLTSRTLVLSLVLIHQHDVEADHRSSAAVMAALVQDIQKAMQVDHRRGGLAINTEELGVGELDAQEGQPELMQTIGYRIRYRHSRIDPTVAG